MDKAEELLEQIILLLKRPQKKDLKPVLIRAIREAMDSDFERVKREKEFHKRLNEDMLSGLHSIYKEISQVTADGISRDVPKSAAEATAIFHEASRQLEAIMQGTLEAAESIMNNAETVQENQRNVAATLEIIKTGKPDENSLERLKDLLVNNISCINDIIVALSFQDLTGQRIKKVVSALGAIHQIVVETYVSAGLMLRKNKESPEKDFDAVAEESRQQALAATITNSELKGPSQDAASQKDVDDLLAQLGF